MRIHPLLLLCVLYLSVNQISYAQGGSDRNHSSPEILYHEPLPTLHVEPGGGGSATSRCSITAFNWDFQLEMESNDQLIAELPLHKREKILSDCKLYRGHVEGVPDSWVRLTQVGEKWSGMLWDGTEVYVIDSKHSIRHMLKTFSTKPTPETVIYKLSDVVGLTGELCGSDPTPAHGRTLLEYSPLLGELQEVIPMEAAGASLNLDVTVVTDTEFAKMQNEIFGTQTAAAVIARMNVVDGIYSEQVGVQISLADIVELKSNGSLTSTNPRTLLGQFSNFSASSSFNNSGAAHLFTGRKLDGNVIGIAYISSLCSQRFGVGVDEIRGGGTTGAFLIAHELAHNFGAPHDNQDDSPCENTPGNFLMNPFLKDTDQFSQCSVDQMQSTINNASCLSVISNNSQPRVTILSPENGSTFTIGDRVNFAGQATDAEDGQLTSSLSWASDVDGRIGNGATFSTRSLSLGQHTITTTVTDSGGRTRNASIRISITNERGDNLITNPSFETDTTGWRSYRNSRIRRVQGGVDGNFSLKVTGPSGSTGKFGVNDSPTWVKGIAAADVRYRFTAWVKSDVSTGSVFFRIREFLNRGKIGPTTDSDPIVLSPTWQKISLDYLSRAAGSTLDFQILNNPDVASEVFQVDDISISVP